MMTQAVIPQSKAGRHGLLPWLVVVVVLLVVLRETVTSMVGIWSRSETFTHGFLVPPISAWLAWRLRDVTAALPRRPAPWVLVPVAMVCALWMAGQLASVQAATHFALVALVVLSVPALYGFEVTRALLFPLLFLFFAVPFGEFLVPQLMDATADFTVTALQWSGVPVYREGLQFVIPTGSWSVVEACSGIRYLIASFMVGSLFAYLNYSSAWRRAAFILVSLAVPLVANWLRAYMIVMIGHVSGNKLAAGVDHLIYGWVFFGLVIALMFMIGSRWAQADPQGALRTRSATLAKGADVSPWRPWPVVAGLVALGVGTAAYVERLDHGTAQPRPVLALATGVHADWLPSAASTSLPDWAPAYRGAVTSTTQAFAGRGHEVGVWVGYYRQQGGARKMVSSTNLLADPKVNGWAQVSAGQRVVAVSGQDLPMRLAQLRRDDSLTAGDAARLAVLQVYWVGGRLTSSDARAKLWTAWDRALGRGDDSAAIMFYMQAGDGRDAVLAGAVQALLPAVLASLDQAQAPR